MQHATRSSPCADRVQMSRRDRSERRRRAVVEDDVDAIAHGRPSCRSAATGPRPSCCRSSRRSWRRSLVETSGPNIRPSGFRWALSWSSTTPGSTLTVIRSRSTIPIRLRCFERSRIKRLPDRLPRQAGRPPLGARPARPARRRSPPSSAHPACPGHDDADRLDLVEAGVGRVQSTVAGVESDLGGCLAGQPVSELRRGLGRRDQQCLGPSARAI